MASLNGKRVLFFTTSPRSPLRMVPEIKLLTEQFSGKRWSGNTALQAEFMSVLSEQDFYVGAKTLNDPALSARDRITRAPKALGFVDLEPEIELTGAGEALVNSTYKEEPLLRQLLKFQFPSPYHTISDGETDFWVKPYLEIIRLIRHFGSLTFDEIQLFGMQLTNYNKFDEIVSKIQDFRKRKALHQGRYREFISEEAKNVVKEVYQKEIQEGNIDIRESNNTSSKKFVDTKKSNMRDYTDACFRYLRETGVVEISQSGRSLSIAPHKVDEVDYFLENIDRNPVFVDDVDGYKEYLFDAELPHLYSDNTENLKKIIFGFDPEANVEGLSLYQLKELQYSLIRKHKEMLLAQQEKELKDYKHFDDIIDVFGKITDKNAFYDAPLMFEWNTWRAMTMLDGGDIKPNLNFDDAGNPLSTAGGNMADIVCDYGDFCLNVEVTLQSGAKQYDNESEPVARHVGKSIEQTGKPTYCFFIAPTITDATKAHFYVLQNTSIRHYGGKANIIPLSLNTFTKMVVDSKQASYVPQPSNIKAFVDKAHELSLNSEDEIDWFDNVQELALDWLAMAS